MKVGIILVVFSYSVRTKFFLTKTKDDQGKIDNGKYLQGFGHNGKQQLQHLEGNGHTKSQQLKRQQGNDHNIAKQLKQLQGYGHSRGQQLKQLQGNGHTGGQKQHQLQSNGHTSRQHLKRLQGNEHTSSQQLQGYDYADIKDYQAECEKICAKYQQTTRVNRAITFTRRGRRSSSSKESSSGGFSDSSYPSAELAPTKFLLKNIKDESSSGSSSDSSSSSASSSRSSSQQSQDTVDIQKLQIIAACCPHILGVTTARPALPIAQGGETVLTILEDPRG